MESKTKEELIEIIEKKDEKIDDLESEGRLLQNSLDDLESEVEEIKELKREIDELVVDINKELDHECNMDKITFEAVKFVKELIQNVVKKNE